MNAFYSIQIVALGREPGPGRHRLGVRRGRSRSRSCTRSRASRRGSAPSGSSSSARSCSRSARLLAAIVVDPVALVLIAPLEGLGFACVFVGGVTVVAARAPAGLQGTAQGLFSASAGLATILGSIGRGRGRRRTRDPRAVRRLRRGRAGRCGDAGCRAPAPRPSWNGNPARGCGVRRSTPSPASWRTHRCATSDRSPRRSWRLVS